MKNMRRMTGVAGIGLFLAVSQALAQGSLTPPGAPGPTMKTLDQVESRIAITNLPHLISTAGSYYLTQNLTGTAGSYGIIINDNNVTLDLNGFQLLGVEGSLDGIVVTGSRSGIVIRNGHVRNWSGTGVNAWNANNSRFENLLVDSCDSSGLAAGERGIVESCTSIGNGTQGIRLGANGQVLKCVAAQNDGGGIWTDDGCIIEECTSSTNDEGVVAGTASIVRNCTVRDNAVDGIRVSHRCQVTDNVSEDNGGDGDGAGIHATGNGNRITGNHAIGADRGLDLDGSFSYIADNTVLGNGDNYDIAAGNELNLLLCEIPETLDWPCSVKLAGTLICAATGTNGITVNADDVTIDMAGHALTGPGASSGSGIYQPPERRNLTVHNGKVVGWQGIGAFGIDIEGTGGQVRFIQATTNAGGISAYYSSTVRDCTAHHNSGTGIYAKDGNAVSGCAAFANGGFGISVLNGCTVSGCAAYSNSGWGIHVGNGGTVSGCTAAENEGHGIDVQSGGTVNGCAAYHNADAGIHITGGTVSDCTVYDNDSGINATDGCALRDCVAEQNSSDGIRIQASNRVEGCVCTGNGHGPGTDGAGIHATYGGNQINDNTVTDNELGMDVDHAGNMIIRNNASGNALNWSVAASNVCLVVLSSDSTNSISGDSGGTSPGSTDPNANFTY